MTSFIPRLRCSPLSQLLCMALAPRTPSSPRIRIHYWVSAYFDADYVLLRTLPYAESNALNEMYALLASSPDLGGITADVKIWNRNESFLALMCDVRHWFAFNVERACQSFWGCVTCISGPMGLYRTYDLDRILSPWSL